VTAFTGRVEDLAELDGLLAGDAPAATAVVISAIAGTAGVGKTALAVHWGHRVAARFPDGQLYVNLRGYDPGPAVSPEDALAMLLRGLGLADADIPHELAERASRYRTVLADRRMLIILDNAHHADQVRDLLPGTDSCFVLVTSRSSLAGLVARDGAHRISLDLLPTAEAVALLRALIGVRVDHEPDAATTLAAQCARLPLALRIAAELASSQPTATLAGLTADLGDEQHRLDLLNAGDDARTAVRAVFSWSYRHLTPAAARAFRLIGLRPGHDIDSHAVSALLDVDVDQARRLLGTLQRGHLIEQATPGRYAMHDLLRAYACAQAIEDPADDRRKALTRVFDHYLHTAGAAMDVLYPHERGRRPHIPTPPTPVPEFTDTADAHAWLDDETANLLTVAAHTATHGWPTYTGLLATTLWRYLYGVDRYHDGLAINAHALAAARQLRDRTGEGAALHHLAGFHYLLGRYDEAENHYQQARAVRRDAGDRHGEGSTLGNLGNVYFRTGRYEEALDHYGQALTIYRDLDSRTSQGNPLLNLGMVYERLGHYAEAIDHYQQALTIYRDVGNHINEGQTLTSLGTIFQRLGRYDDANDRHHQALAIFREAGERNKEGYVLASLGQISHRLGHHAEALDRHQQALTIFRAVGNRHGEGDALTGLGTVQARLGHHLRAIDHHQQAVSIGREIGDPSLEVESLNSFGETLLATGRSDDAHHQHEYALTLAQKIGNRYEQARALNGIAHSLQATGHLDQAHEHWRQAFGIYTDLGLPQADEIIAHLTL
jgi:tetratricopeptide (TPR) repeat protein